MTRTRANDVVTLTDVVVGYDKAPPTLVGITTYVGATDYVTIAGRSGSGKSTLLNVMAGTVFAQSGAVQVADFNMSASRQRVQAQRDVIGYLFQAAHLVPWMSALQNVELGMRYQGVSARERTVRATEALERVQLEHREAHRPAELSGGERQRVALARALARRPRVLLADEPTGNLDQETGASVIQLLEAVTAHAALVLVTHDPALALRGTRRWRVVEGSLHEE